ncbi:hypothetical protein BZ163_27185 [Pseudomonas sp. VI4.1]|jgi:hypothetical protein|nr:hypothetical protein BZ163_27185 [Pseudomonas sp. VI4.1]
MILLEVRSYHLRYQTKGGSHTQVGRPVQGAGALESALRMTTIKAGTKKTCQGAVMRLEEPGYQTRSLMGSDAEKIKPAKQAHKSANSEVVVVPYARTCRLRL